MNNGNGTKSDSLQPNFNHELCKDICCMYYNAISKITFPVGTANGEDTTAVITALCMRACTIWLDSVGRQIDFSLVKPTILKMQKVMIENLSIGNDVEAEGESSKEDE